MKVLLLFSGGLDSTVLAHIAQSEGHELTCLFVRYGQPACPQEYRAVRAWCHQHDVPLHDRVLTGINIGKMEDEPGETGPRVVPARNLLLLAMALNLAASLGLDEIWYGAEAGDAENYADCREDFVLAMGYIAQFTEGVRIKAPLLEHDRAAVMEKAASLAIDLGRVWSCYNPQLGDPCGACDSCLQGTEA